MKIKRVEKSDMEECNTVRRENKSVEKGVESKAKSKRVKKKEE